MVCHAPKRSSGRSLSVGVEEPQIDKQLLRPWRSEEFSPDIRFADASDRVGGPLKRRPVSPLGEGVPLVAAAEGSRRPARRSGWLENSSGSERMTASSEVGSCEAVGQRHAQKLEGYSSECNRPSRELYNQKPGSRRLSPSRLSGSRYSGWVCQNAGQL